jgi:gamma-D-glutamyl-L-lysine dipeptidyl-peptidase
VRSDLTERLYGAGVVVDLARPLLEPLDPALEPLGDLQVVDLDGGVLPARPANTGRVVVGEAVSVEVETGQSFDFAALAQFSPREDPHALHSQSAHRRGRVPRRPDRRARPGQPANAAAAPTPPSAFVDVSVATVWTSPTSARPIDLPALTNPVDIQGWLASMTTAQKRDLTSGNRTQTQALYGQPVYVLASQGDWDEIAVPGQPTPKNPLGYPGWVPKAQLDTSAPAFAALHRSRPFALIDRAATAWLYDDPLLTHRDLRLSVNTRLQLLARTPHAILVATPGAGPKWLSAQDATVYHSDRDIPYPTGTELVRFAETFAGWPYLWAGRSGFAFDCSGFTSTIYQTHGITIGRDADVQAHDSGGTPVARDDLQPGDLLFYADAKGTGSIYHVAMYAGNGQMIEAYDAATLVRVTPVRFGTDYWGAERYLHGN